jgi:hypothetical protein
MKKFYSGTLGSKIGARASWCIKISLSFLIIYLQFDSFNNYEENV